MTPIDFSQARQLCSPDELRLVEASRRGTLGKLDAATLNKTITQVRRLRDKWRDVSTRQVRRSQGQAGARVSDENQRSQQKAELFQHVLVRLEAQRERLAASPAAAPSAPAGRKPAKPLRAQEHRAKRAGVKGQLQQKAAKLNQKAIQAAGPTRHTTAPSSPAAAAAKDAGQATASKQKAGAGTKKAASKKAAKKLASLKKKLPARKKAAVQQPPAAAESTRPAVPASPLKSARQLRAATAAKQARIQASGLNTRTRGHVSARGKRNQARRDARN